MKRLVLLLLLPFTLYAFEVSFQVTERGYVDNDLVSVIIEVMGEGKSTVDAYDAMGRSLEGVVDIIEDMGLTYRTLDMGSSAIYQDGERVGYRAYYTMEVESGDFGKVGELVESVTDIDGVSVVDTSFFPSQDKLWSLVKQLSSKALSKVLDMGDTIKNALGAGGFSIKRLDLSTGSSSPYPVYKAVGEGVPLEGGSSQVTVTVSAVLEVE